MTKKTTFEDIRKIDVSDHIEKKMGLSYLSWAWAWDEMKKINETASIQIHQYVDTELLSELASKQTITPELIETLPMIDYKKDKAGATVKVSVTLNGRTETESLPVMNFKNKAVVNPDAMEINKAHKRCFVKALALHGLGLYIYAGEDLPQEPKEKEPTRQELDKEANQRIKALYERLKELDSSLDDESITNKLKEILGAEDLKKVNKGLIIKTLQERVKNLERSTGQDK
ncbi:MAG: DUF1071 domain-containing protein [Clostridium celatum]|nr:DUF1071 domain-containing protein [Clostridium celatum]